MEKSNKVMFEMKGLQVGQQTHLGWMQEKYRVRISLESANGSEEEQRGTAAIPSPRPHIYISVWTKYWNLFQLPC